MTLDQLRVFIAVAERQHVTRGAEALNLAQSAASAAIAALEAQYGTPLFHRQGRGIVLTEAGTLFLTEAHAVLARVAAAELVLTDLAGLRRGTLLVQASQTIAGYWLPRRLAEFHARHPAIALRLGIGNTAQAAALVRDGSAELGFLEGAIDDPQLLLREVARDNLVVVVAPDHPWADGRALVAADLARAEWVLREPGSGTRSVFEAALRGAGVEPETLNRALVLPSNEAVRGAVEAGLGATAISASVAAASLEAGLLRRAGFSLPDRAFFVVRHAQRSPTPAAAALLDVIGL